MDSQLLPGDLGRRPATRGALSTGLVSLLVLVFLVLALGGCGVKTYNGIISNQESVGAAWSEIDNQYKRRFDLVPMLVETVKGAAEFEQTVLTDVTEARASVGRVQLPGSLPTDPAQLEAYMAAQQGLSGALGRLFAVSEAYPQLRASQNFLALQDQLEGTENRIATARRDYIDAVKIFNASIRKFPGNVVASFGGFESSPQLTIEEAVREVPAVEFDFGGDEG